MVSGRGRRGTGVGGASGPEGQALAEVVLTSGERFEAVVLEEDASSVTFRTSAGQVRKIDRQLIAPPGTRDRETRPEEPGLEDPSANRLLLIETARPLGRGNGSVAAHYFLAAPLGTVSYGLTDQISLGAGLTAIPGSESQVAFLYAKAGWTLAPRKALAVGLFHARGWGEEDGVAVLYAVSSFGPPSRSLSLGMALAATREIVPGLYPGRDIHRFRRALEPRRHDRSSSSAERSGLGRERRSWRRAGSRPTATTPSCRSARPSACSEGGCPWIWAS